MGNMLAEHVVWAIERNLDRPLTLAELADACGVSRFHLAHAFGRATGLSVMHYVRARRLSEAARSHALFAPSSAPPRKRSARTEMWRISP
jgi:AraC family transcriptional regulator